MQQSAIPLIYLPPLQVPSRNLDSQVQKRLATEVQLGKLLQDHQDLLARLLQAEEEAQKQQDCVAFLTGKNQVSLLSFHSSGCCGVRNRISK